MKKIKVSCVGDVFICNDIRYSETKPVKILRESNYVFANLEGVLTDRGRRAEKWACIRYDPKVVDLYKGMNISIFTLANNHSLDYGEAGLIDTMSYLKRAGIGYVGAGMNIEESFKPTILDCDRLSLGFMGISSTLPLGSQAGIDKPGIAPIRIRSLHYFDPLAELEQPGTPPITVTQPYREDMDYAMMKVREAKKRCDILIVGVHWGMPYQENIMDYQEIIGRKLIESGASIVIGSHPHRLQAIESYKDGLIFYSLGNFMFELPSDFKPNVNEWNYWPPRLGMWSESNDSGIVTISIADDLEFEFYPTIRESGMLPIEPDAKARERIISNLKRLSDGRGVKIIEAGHKYLVRKL